MGQRKKRKRKKKGKKEKKEKNNSPRVNIYNESAIANASIENYITLIRRLRFRLFFIESDNI